MICSWVGIRYYEENARSKIYVDFLFHALMFAKAEANFSQEKMAALFSVLQFVFEASTGYSSSIMQDVWKGEGMGGGLA
jgi:hypothetical protein